VFEYTIGDLVKVLPGVCFARTPSNSFTRAGRRLSVDATDIGPDANLADLALASTIFLDWNYRNQASVDGVSQQQPPLRRRGFCMHHYCPQTLVGVPHDWRTVGQPLLGFRIWSALEVQIYFWNLSMIRRDGDQMVMKYRSKA